MKDFDGIILFVFGVIIAGLLFWGIVTAIGRSFKPKEVEKSSFNSAQMISEQKSQAEEIRARQKEMMRQNQQKIRDSRR